MKYYENYEYSRHSQERYKPITAAIFALAKENYDVVSWLEEQGAIDHQGKSVYQARKMLELVE